MTNITQEQLREGIQNTFNKLSKDFKKIYDKLPSDEQITIWALWDNGFFLDKQWEEDFDRIIIHPDDKKENG